MFTWTFISVIDDWEVSLDCPLKNRTNYKNTWRYGEKQGRITELWFGENEKSREMVPLLVCCYLRTLGAMDWLSTGLLRGKSGNRFWLGHSKSSSWINNKLVPVNPPSFELRPWRTPICSRNVDPAVEMSTQGQSQGWMVGHARGPLWHQVPTLLGGW